MYKKPYRYWDTLVDIIDMGSLKQWLGKRISGRRNSNPKPLDEEELGV